MIPEDYTEQISSIASPPTIPIAVVVEDQGAEINGQPVTLGEEVAGRISSPDSPAPGFVHWNRVSMTAKRPWMASKAESTLRPL